MYENAYRHDKFAQLRPRLGQHIIIYAMLGTGAANATTSSQDKQCRNTGAADATA